MNEILLPEIDVHSLIVNDVMVQDGIKNALNVETDINLIHEDEYINGIIADFTLLNENKIRAIVEVKGGNINVTDYVRGIGQIFQYEYFYEKNISPKSIEYADNFNSIYFFPSSVIRNNMFNIGRFKYPQNAILLELNESSNIVRYIEQKELLQLEAASNNGIVTISQYYFRDNRIFEYYILLKYLLFLEQTGVTQCKRKKLDEEKLKKIETINNGNWRNAFITISSLGLINGKNMLTYAGKKLAILTYEQFAVKMYYSYIHIYSEQILKCFNEANTIIANNTKFSNIIKSNFRDRDVLFLTQSDNRYISSWLNILRDDYGIISFLPKNNNRILNYNPSDLNEIAFEKYIKKHSIAYKYIDKYQELLRKGII